MDDGGNLSLRSSLHGGLVEISVTDDGTGVPEENREKIFTPFFTTKKCGTGLGLSIAKRIIEDQEGCSFSLKSEKGKGTTVTITIPASKAWLSEAGALHR
ncbi:MAG: HAMP domain-containing histidine kinase [Deltaproteobacteria bacterium]|nr:HAMP domain-containing histidine kinase [Deltaproteobacteria bacterium]